MYFINKSHGYRFSFINKGLVDKALLINWNEDVS